MLEAHGSAVAGARWDVAIKAILINGVNEINLHACLFASESVASETQHYKQLSPSCACTSCCVPVSGDRGIIKTEPSAVCAAPRATTLPHPLPTLD